MSKLHVIISSTRPSRKGPSIARWFAEFAREKSGFEVELADLADYALPVFDESGLPLRQEYEQEHTKKWAAKILEADAFVFVTPEYNYFMGPALLNALTYLSHEWNYAPAGFVSYGGTSGGLRGVQPAKTVMTGLKLMPLPETVSVQHFEKLIGEDGVFTPEEYHLSSGERMLKELERWTEALAPLRAEKRA